MLGAVCVAMAREDLSEALIKKIKTIQPHSQIHRGQHIRRDNSSNMLVGVMWCVCVAVWLWFVQCCRY